MKKMKKKVMVILKTIKSIFKTAKQFEDQIETVSKAMNFKRVAIYGDCYQYEYDSKPVSFAVTLYLPEKTLSDTEKVIETGTNFIAIKYGIEKERIDVRRWMLL